MRKKWSTGVIFIIGFALCCLPIIWNVIEQRHQSDAVATYQNAVSKKDDTKLKEIMDNAAAYNDMLYQTGGAVVDNSDTEILSDENYDGGEVDAAIVVSSMMYEATELGLGTLWARGFDSRKIVDAFGLPPNLHVVCLLDIGYAAEESEPSERHFLRKPLSESVKEI